MIERRERHTEQKVAQLAFSGPNLESISLPGWPRPTTWIVDETTTLYVPEGSSARLSIVQDAQSEAIVTYLQNKGPKNPGGIEVCTGGYIKTEGHKGFIRYRMIGGDRILLDSRREDEIVLGSLRIHYVPFKR